MSLPRTPAVPFYRLLLIDEDPVFRLGLKVWLNQYPDLSVVAEAEDGETALQILDHQSADPLDLTSSDPIVPANLIVLDVSLGRSNPDQLQGINLCHILKSRYPDLPILCLSNSPEPIILAAAQQSGANGYCAKSIEAAELVAVIRRVASGSSIWTPSSSPLTDIQFAEQNPNALVRQSRAPLVSLRRNLRLSGLRQIESALTDVTNALQDLNLSLLDRAVLAGRQRELRTARWLVKRLLATPNLVDSPQDSSGPARPKLTPPQPPVERRMQEDALGTIIPAPGGAIIDIQSVQSLVFDTLLGKIQTGLANQTELALETDILREDKKQDLFNLIARKLEDVLAELRYSQVAPQQLSSKRSTILLDLWQTVLVDFLGRYYTVRLGSTDVEVVESLLQEADIVQVAILDRIPGVTELLLHFLFETPLVVDSIPYPVGNPESLARAELLLENLVIQMANAVMQPLLNRFPNVESIKQNLYDRRLLSSREIERFRNNLSWKYRVDRIFRDPQNIFESQYRLFTLTGRSIKQTSIYAPRIDELEQLSGVPYVVTLALETRDAISPRLRAAVSFVGNGFVYILTEVIGRGIGLIGRGVLKGLGNVWQDPSKYGRDRSR